MIPTDIYNPAIQKARSRDHGERHTTAEQGMIGALETWRIESPRWGANRKADGLGPIDSAVASVRSGWPNRVGANADLEVTNLLSACRYWLDNRKHITGWRKPAIEKLYWQVAWAYSCDNFAQQAYRSIHANNAGAVAVYGGTGGAIPTSIRSVINNTDPLGNPYDFANSGYSFDSFSILYRGDSRNPLNISTSLGFQARNFNDSQRYSPWFDGHAMGDTISTTDDASLAINAATAAIHGNRDGQYPLWIPDILPKYDNNINKTKGYVYEINIPAGFSATRMEYQSLGREEVFLSIPHNLITRWWIVLVDSKTLGPFQFPAAGNAPEIHNRSNNRLELARLN